MLGSEPHVVPCRASGRNPRFFSDPRPRRGRHVLAPRNPSDPATLPTPEASQTPSFARERRPPQGQRPARQGAGGGGAGRRRLFDAKQTARSLQIARAELFVLR